MSKEKISICTEFYDIMPPEYRDLVEQSTYGKEDRGLKDIGRSSHIGPDGAP